MNTLAKKSLFWDVKRIDPRKNEGFVIERILNYGDEKDFRWAMDFYSENKIIENLLSGKSLDKKSLFFWCRYFNLNNEKCLATRLTKKQSAFWKR